MDCFYTYTQAAEWMAANDVEGSTEKNVAIKGAVFKLHRTVGSSFVAWQAKTLQYADYAAFFIDSTARLLTYNNSIPKTFPLAS